MRALFDGVGVVVEPNELEPVYEAYSAYQHQHDELVHLPAPAEDNTLVLDEETARAVGCSLRTLASELEARAHALRSQQAFANNILLRRTGVATAWRIESEYELPTLIARKETLQCLGGSLFSLLRASVNANTPRDIV